MEISQHTTDEGILKELGERLAGARLARNLTQAALAEQAGLSKRTVERLESGEVAARLSAFLRVCRVLDLLDRLDALLPEAQATPMQLLRMKGRQRKRASRTQPPSGPRPWTWGDEPRSKD
jgi:transcriptional regulator with XRE-family HTH domain